MSTGHQISKNRCWTKKIIKSLEVVKKGFI